MRQSIVNQVESQRFKTFQSSTFYTQMKNVSQNRKIRFLYSLINLNCFLSYRLHNFILIKFILNASQEGLKRRVKRINKAGESKHLKVHQYNSSIYS